MQALQGVTGLGLSGVGEHHQEAGGVVAQDGIGAAEGLLDHLRRFDEQLVGGQLAVSLRHPQPVLHLRQYQGQAGAEAGGAADLLGQDGVQVAAVEHLGEGIDQGEGLQALAEDDFAYQLLPGAMLHALLVEDVAGEDEDEHEQPHDELQQVRRVQRDVPLVPHQPGKGDHQEAGSQDQHHQQPDRPQLHLAAGEAAELGFQLLAAGGVQRQGRVVHGMNLRLGTRGAIGLPATIR